MTKNIAPLLIIILLIALSAMFVNLATANPSPELDFPLKPVSTQPTIVVHSPVQNQNYNSTNVWLNFTIIKPEEWIQRSGKHGGSDGEGNKFYDVLGNVTSVYYIVDGCEHQNISLLDSPSLFDFHPKPLTLNLSIKLTLSQGAHNVKVGFEADSFYLHMWDSWNGDIFSTKVNGSSDIVSFTVLQEPFPTALVVTVSGASASLAIVGLIVHFRKHNGGKTP